jgi:hypothetical protein
MQKVLIEDRLPLYSALSAGFNAAFAVASIQITLPCDIYQPSVSFTGVARAAQGFLTIGGEAYTWAYNQDFIPTMQGPNGGPLKLAIRHQGKNMLKAGTDVQVVITSLFGLTAAGLSFGSVELHGKFDYGITHNASGCSDSAIETISKSLVMNSNRY